MAKHGECATCAHFDPAREYRPGIPDSFAGRDRVNFPPNTACGACCAYPPLASVNGPSVWPIVREMSWCGEWKANEKPVYNVAEPGRIDR